MTEQQHAADINREYRRQMTTILTLTGATAFVASRDGLITSIPHWETEFLTNEEPLGLKLIELTHPAEREDSIRAWQTAIARGGRYNSEHRILHPDGTYHWRRCSALPIKSNDGSIREWIGLTHDIHSERSGAAIRQSQSAVTGAQIRSARSILRLSVRDLHDLTGVTIGTIRRIEDIDGISSEDQQTATILRMKMEERGVTFIFPSGVKPAVCPI